mmetsp:Transcript_11012/g.25566  ORF Transcript_11012/g.25566 Transcript_11012/m.25566 type:complete len:398 (+) Transcript_11012:1-1194(+)
MIQALADTANCSLMTMSNISEEGVSAVKTAACDKLLSARVDARVAGQKVEHIMNRLQVFHPAPRDAIERKACVPESVLKKQQEEGERTGHDVKRTSNAGYAPTIHDDDDDVEMKSTKKTARDLMWENGGPGVWAPDYREQYDLSDPSWRFDAIPEIMDGKNIADFVDPEIEQRLEALEKEEEQLVAELEAAAMEQEPESDLDSEEEAAVHAIRERKKITRIQSRTNNTQNKPIMPRSIRGRAKDKHDTGVLSEEAIKKRMDSYGVDASKMLERGRSMERGRKRERSLSRRRSEESPPDDDEMEVDETGLSKGEIKKAKKAKVDAKRRESSLARSHSRPREPSEQGLKPETVPAAKKLDRLGRKEWKGASGEGDKRKSVHLVKWMNTGKKRMGTHYCR